MKLQVLRGGRSERVLLAANWQVVGYYDTVANGSATELVGNRIPTGWTLAPGNPTRFDRLDPRDEA